ncbi:MAG: hypothetical protein BWY52_02395 [Chloroflexi bacterium ADurb.Bin325]|nr:MAG: hypothetical protein BWY52_02395 [Chloroflexi bacterium ADurb.Bin325]
MFVRRGHADPVCGQRHIHECVTLVRPGMAGQPPAVVARQLHRQPRAPAHLPGHPAADARIPAPGPGLLRLRLERIDDGQLSARPARAVPRRALPHGLPAPQGVVAEQPERGAEEVVRRMVEAGARAHHAAAGLEGLRRVELGRGRGIARVGPLADDIAVLGREDGQGAADLVADQPVVALICAPARRVIERGRARVRVIAALLVDARQAPPLPRVRAPLLARDTAVELRGVGRALLVARIVGVVERVVEAVVVDGLPNRLAEQVAAAQAADLAHDIPGCAGCQRGDGGIAAALQDGLHIHDGVARDDGQRIRGPLAALPLHAEIRLVVELEIAHARGHVVADRPQPLRIEHARVGLGPIEPDDGHDVVLEQQLHEPQRAVVVGDLDPLDAQRLELRQPRPLDIAQADGRGKAGAPMNADAGVVLRSRIIT